MKCFSCQTIRRIAFAIGGAAFVISSYGQALAPEAPSDDQSVAWQNNQTHDGFDRGSSLVPPLTMKWKRDLTSAGVTSISYPLIAQGMVYITVTTSNSTESLLALDETTGATVWSADVTGTYGFANAAYDAGKVFVVNYDGLMQAFNATTGSPLWSVALPGQYSFTSPPTAQLGIVYTGGSGTGGTVYALRENTGALAWTASVENGDHSSPAIFKDSVYVSYTCPQAYSFQGQTGQLLWHYSDDCEGGGGKTPVLYEGRLYVRDYLFGSVNGLILNGRTGAVVDQFDSDRPPAFIKGIGVYLQSGTLRGVNITNQSVLWSFAGSGNLTSAPLIVKGTIYIGASSGLLYGLNVRGQQVWSTQVGAAIPAPDEHNATLITGLGAGDGLLIVPTASTLVAYGN